MDNNSDLPAAATAGPIASLFPDAILGNIQIAHPKEVLCIKGTVTKLKAWPAGPNPTWIYGELKGRDAHLQFRCPPGSSPALEGELTVLSGLLRVTRSKVHDGLQVLLDGERIGTWNPAEATSLVKLERIIGRTSLNTFIRYNGLAGLLILATSRGETDYLTAAAKYGPMDDGPKMQINFSDKGKLLNDLEEAFTRAKPKGIAFARGGSDGATLRLWDDPEVVAAILAKNVPYYTAIGHADRLLLADQWSDESFPTPTALGDALGQIMAQIQEDKHRLNVMSNLGTETQALKIHNRRLTMMLIVLASLFVLTVIVGGWILGLGNSTV